MISKDAGKISYSAQGINDFQRCRQNFLQCAGYQCFPKMPAISLSVHRWGAAGVLSSNNFPSRCFSIRSIPYQYRNNICVPEVVVSHFLGSRRQFFYKVLVNLFTIDLNSDLQRLAVASGMRLDSTLREHRYCFVSHFNCRTYLFYSPPPEPQNNFFC